MANFNFNGDRPLGIPLSARKSVSVAMADFDALPPQLRQAVREFPLPIAAASLGEGVREFGIDAMLATLANMRRKIEARPINLAVTCDQLALTA